MSNELDKKKKHLYCVDIFRILVVFLILLFHINIHYNFETHIIFLDRFIRQGATAMIFFFMLSGFLLYYLYSDNEFFNWNVLKDFYKKRFIKIYPLYIFCVAMFYLLFYIKKQLPLVIWVMQIIPLQAFFPKTFYIFWNNGLWFLSVIAFLYLCFPFLSYILKSMKINSYILFSIVYILCNYFIITELYYPDSSFYVSPILRLIEFFCGMVVAKIYIKEQNKIYKHCSSVLFFAITAYILFVGGLSHSNYLNHVFFGNNFLNFDIALLPIFSIILFYSAALKSGRLYKFAKSNVCQYLSKISYAFYLAQGFVITAFLGYTKVINTIPDYRIFIIAICCNTLLAILLYECVQKRLWNYIFSKAKSFSIEKD